MPSFEHTIDIAAPLADVFAFGIEPENWQRTTPGLSNIHVVQETDDGLSLEATYSLLGREMAGTLEMRILEPDHHVVTTFDSPGMTGELHYRFEEIEDGTRVIQQCEYEFGDSLLQRILEPVAKRYNKRQFEESLRTMKDLIEAEVSADASSSVAA